MEALGPVVRSPADGIGFGYRVTLSVAILVMVLAGAFLVWSPSVQAQSQVDYDITVEKRVVFIDIRPGQSGMANNTITVTNNGRHTETIEVRINCGRFFVSPSYSTVDVGGNQSVIIPITIFAPTETVREQADCVVHARIVGLDNPPPPDPNRSTGFKAIVLQYSQVSVEADPPFLQIRPGEQIPVTFKVHNSGNYSDDYQFEVVNYEKLEDAGFSINLVIPLLWEVEANSSAPLSLTIQAPHGWALGWSDRYFTMEVKVTSFVEGYGGDFRVATVTIWVRGLYIDYVPVGILMLLIISIAVVVIDKIKNKTKEDRTELASVPIPDDEFKRP